MNWVLVNARSYVPGSNAELYMARAMLDILKLKIPDANIDMAIRRLRRLRAG